ncbi:MAG TPA: manganese efflux pump MntP family protein [Desulfomonilaceae bacterium]|nr:manganese efflux pump MntP family protein [Desulfomonilaceae bacterium]
MDILTLIGTAVALGTDAFAVAAAVAACLPSVTPRHTFRLAWHFGLFQSMMTAFGWLGGEGLSRFTSGFNNWIAFAILLLLGLNMIRQSLREETCIQDFDPTRGWSLVGLSVATSIDALAVGISFSLLRMEIFSPALVIGLAALVMTYVGTRLGLRAGIHLGKWAERVGGLVLVALGFRILVQQMS